MSDRSKDLLLIGFISSFWLALESLNQGLFGINTDELIYFVYWLSGIRLVAIITFGWVGFWGILIGYFIGEILLRDYSVIDATFLSILTSLAPLLAYRLWQSAAHKEDDFDDVNFIQLCYLVFLYSFLTALFRNVYFYVANTPYGVEQITMAFSANVIGSFLFLYMLMFINRFLKFLKKLSIRDL
jgi:hypothetical protein